MLRLTPSPIAAAEAAGSADDHRASSADQQTPDRPAPTGLRIGPQHILRHLRRLAGRQPAQLVAAHVAEPVFRRPSGITFRSFRHGGFTAGGDADLSDADLSAIGAKTDATLDLYRKGTMLQRQRALTRLLDQRSNQQRLSTCAG
jgi:hypothetical protein